jgi:hypothetical protein
MTRAKGRKEAKLTAVPLQQFFVMATQTGRPMLKFAGKFDTKQEALNHAQELGEDYDI